MLLAGALWTVQVPVLVLLTVTIGGFIPFVRPETVPATDQGDEPIQTCWEGQCTVTEDANDVNANVDANADSERDAYYHSALRYIDIDFGENQQVAGETWRETIAVIDKTLEYMKHVRTNRTFDHVRADCRCRHELCSFWAAIGECEKNPDFMKMQCAPSCQTCEQLDFEFRCPFDKTAPSVWQSGDLDKMFQKLTTDPHVVDKYKPTIFSKPPEGPWVVTLENVASPDECEAMIEAGRVRGYERSKDVGSRKFDGTFDSFESDDRTSSNTWCVDECYDDQRHQNVLKIVENITGIPEKNSEYWQLLHYQEGQFYRRHHDYIPFHNFRSQGVRILTVFVYLNNVTEGGGTRFTDLDITVEPRQGRALLWPSVLNDSPSTKDKRTHHEALPVIRGEKYGANGWYHERDFKTPYANGCS